MKFNKYILFSLIVVLISFGLGIYLYPQMPERMASHWNIKGEVDGYLSKFWALFLMPIIAAGILLLSILIPKIDPLKHNIEKFRKYFDSFIFIIILFLFYIYLLTIFWNKGIKLSIPQAISPAIGIMFFYAGVLIKNAKRNWFIGIRTPWTLSDEKVWENTHRIGARLFKISGIVALAGIIFPGYALFLILVPMIFSTLFVIAVCLNKYL